MCQRNTQRKNQVKEIGTKEKGEREDNELIFQPPLLTVMLILTMVILMMKVDMDIHITIMATVTVHHRENRVQRKGRESERTCTKTGTMTTKRIKRDKGRELGIGKCHWQI